MLSLSYIIHVHGNNLWHSSNYKDVLNTFKNITKINVKEGHVININLTHTQFKAKTGSN